ncbi:hypothetical protein [Marininema halotolerans]|uniref:Uncharacterized protein n=1 Tax=Marininema halotolerans TaxID=1155944 RepID=A0A1I6U0P6_9BACL|nr:hypothetical protein [Marininema halotolerans]SFS94990.1 hypothetical protein SAMN05444972_11282 [Marininema halotolerans]
MARKILDYAASVPLSVQTGAIPVPTTPARLQLASVGIFIPPSHAGANRVEITATVGLENTNMDQGTLRFRIFRDGGEIFNALQDVQSSAFVSLDTAFTFDTVDFNLSKSFHIYFVTVESIDFVGNVIGPITLSALAIGTADTRSKNPLLNYQASVPQSVEGVASPVDIPTSPARVQIAGLGIFIPPSSKGNNRVQLKATIGIQLIATVSNAVHTFRIFRDGGEIFNTQATLEFFSFERLSIAFHTIDFNVSPGFHVYSLTAEEIGPSTTQVIGPIVFSGIVIDMDTNPIANQNNQILDYNASVPRSVQVPGSRLTIPSSPDRLQVAGTGVYLPSTSTRANRVQLQGTIGCLFEGSSNVTYSQLLIRIFRDGGEIFNAPYSLIPVGLNNFFTISIQTIDFNLNSLFHVYSMTIESLDFVGTPGLVVGPITFSALAISVD